VFIIFSLSPTITTSGRQSGFSVLIVAYIVMVNRKKNCTGKHNAEIMSLWCLFFHSLSLFSFHHHYQALYVNERN
jgi:hypothetical protein